MEKAESSTSGSSGSESSSSSGSGSSKSSASSTPSRSPQSKNKGKPGEGASNIAVNKVPPPKSSSSSSSGSSSSSSSGSESSGSETSSSSGSPTPERKPALRPSRPSSSSRNNRNDQRPDRYTSDFRRRPRSISPIARHDRNNGRAREQRGLADRRPARSREETGRHHERGSERRVGRDDSRDEPRGKRRDMRDRSMRGNSRERDERHAKKPREAEPRSSDRRADRPLPGPPPRSDRERPRAANGFGDAPKGRGEEPEARGAPADTRAEEVWGRNGNQAPRKKEEKKVEPNFGLSGALAEETNTVNNVSLVYNEPQEAANPTLRWRLYTFKGGDLVGEPLYIHRQRSYLFGRERRVADIPADHPSCSKQHAVLQYRLTSKDGIDGMPSEAVRPYLMDLGSTNGTFINSEQLEAQRYYELMEKDVVKLGNSSREYVLLHEGSLNS